MIEERNVKEIIDIAKITNKDIEYLKNSDLPLVLYGIAELGRTVKCFLDNNNIKIDFVVIDKEYWKPNIKFYDFNVFSLEDILTTNSNINIIVAFSSGQYIEKITQLNNLQNVQRCLFFDVFPYFNFDFDFVKQSMNIFADLYYCFADDLSRKVLLEFMKAKNLMNAVELIKLNIKNEVQYFPNFLLLSDGETFVDCGAYTGDTIEIFLNKTHRKFNKIFAFEPDSTNIQKCKENIANLEVDIVLLDKGSYKESKTLYFNNNNSSNSSIDEKGNFKIEVDSIDNICKNEKVSFIKMDVEGAELDSLKGAEKQIKANKPKLAICVYHKQEDLITIPQYILSLNPNYKLYLRHYGNFCTELVLYAV